MSMIEVEMMEDHLEQYYKVRITDVRNKIKLRRPLTFGRVIPSYTIKVQLHEQRDEFCTLWVGLSDICLTDRFFRHFLDYDNKVIFIVFDYCFDDLPPLIEFDIDVYLQK